MVLPFGKELPRGGIFFYKGIKLIPGDGSTLSFWHDIWIDGTLLCRLYPEIYGLVTNKSAWIADYLPRGEARAH